MKSYNPKKFGNKNGTRDFNSNWYNDHPWLGYLVEDKTALSYVCKKFICIELAFLNWKKPEHLLKHHKIQDYGVAMAKFIAFSKSMWRKTSIAKQIDDKWKEKVQQNREFQCVLIACLVFSVQQNR